MSMAEAPVKPSEAGGVGSGPVAGNIYLAGANRIKDYAGSVFNQRKPWTEAFDRTAFSKPENVGEAWTRIRKNMNYFKVNYFILTLTTLAICFIFNPKSLFAVFFLLAAWLYVFVIRTSPLVISGREISEREKLLGMSGISLIVVFFLTSVASVVFSALMLSLALIGLHGAMRTPDDLFLDDAGTQQSLFSFLSPQSTGMTSSMATTVATSV